MKISEIVKELHSLGYSIYLENDTINYKFIRSGIPDGELVKPLLNMLKQNKTAVIDFLQTVSAQLSERMCIEGENTELEQTMPFVTDYGVLVIPFNSSSKYHWWKGGQSPCDT
ncbi:MAG: hypothetical protein FJY07_05780, partial [Bacteroidetes bacterium]|nr:hypothetical protein [Bacteroidota bacterium]